jgi:hypothetical protein
LVDGTGDLEAFMRTRMVSGLWRGLLSTLRERQAEEKSGAYDERTSRSGHSTVRSPDDKHHPEAAAVAWHLLAHWPFVAPFRRMWDEGLSYVQHT